jgi:integrase
MIPRRKFHALRHTFAALSIAAGVDIYTVSRLIGHSSINMTADTYGHLYDAGRGQAADALDRLLTFGA